MESTHLPASVMAASLGDIVISILMSVRVLTAVEMADALMEWAPSNASVILATSVCCVR
jgi:hypothetical protein